MPGRSWQQVGDEWRVLLGQILEAWYVYDADLVYSVGGG